VAVVLVFLLVFSYGYISHRNQIFPHSIIRDTGRVIKTLRGGSKPWFYQKTDFQQSIIVNQHGANNKSLTLLTLVGPDNSLQVKVIDLGGNIVQQWDLNWFDIWPDATHIPEIRIPKSPPGTHVHGVALMENGDLVFNFEYLGLIRVNPCNDIEWKIPYSTHHSIFKENDNSLWVVGQKIHEGYDGGNIKFDPFYMEETIINVSGKGEILKEISIQDVLNKNNLHGFLFMTVLKDGQKETSGDLLHMNDIDIFPEDMEEGVFNKGDIMISLRNVNTVIVFDPNTLKVKAITTGEVVKQHDPDFVDGNTISIFDNNDIESYSRNISSRIFIKSFSDSSYHSYYSGSDINPFYSQKMGRHQWLQNGNLLITESMTGRAFEIDSAGTIVWEYVNVLGDGYVGILEDAERLESNFTSDFFSEKTADCN